MTAETSPEAAPEPARLGTFEGVFVPTSMTILGVILFVRTAWVVGEVGLLGAVAVIAAAFAVSTTTALSLASIVTNVRIDAGGAFALLTRTLGIEPGGSIGLPLYLSQTLAIPMYVFGFREGWVRVFPDHDALLVDSVVAVVVFAAAAISARFAFRLQFVVLGVIAVAVGSVLAGLFTAELQSPDVLRLDSEVGLLGAFAVFFPAVTGIMAGVNMSGELDSPRRSIVRGSLWAIGVTFVVYLAVAACAALLVDPETLRSTNTALVDVAAWGPLVIAGLLAATFSSALSTAVGAPRILQALASHRVVPAGSFLEQRGWLGQPHRALAVTAVVVAIGVALRDLNTIAPLITLFFLLTYLAINATLLLQQGLELPRFRPSFRVPLVVPLVGTVGCAVGMVLVSPTFTVVALAAVAALYAWLLRRAPEGPFGQVRAGILLGLFAWVVGRLSDVPTNMTWQAHVLVAVSDTDDTRGLTPLLRAVARRGGSVGLLELRGAEDVGDLAEHLREAGIVTRRGRSAGEHPEEAIRLAIDTLDVALFRPNLLVLPLPRTGLGQLDGDDLRALMRRARRAGLGFWLAWTRDTEPVEDEEDDGVAHPPWPRVCLWVDAEALGLDLSAEGLSLVLLTAWRVHVAHQLDVDVMVAGIDDDGRDDAQRAVDQMLERARIPGASRGLTSVSVVEAMEDAGEALHLVVTPDPYDPKTLQQLRDATHGQLVVACLSGPREAQ